MRYPDWIELAYLTLATFRLWKLLADDAILDGPRDWLLIRVPEKIEELWECPWCLGFWIGGLLWAAWWWWPTATLAAVTPFVISALVGIVREVEHYVAAKTPPPSGPHP